MSLKGERVLLTGGTGFIGSAVARALAEEGADVRLLVRSSSNGRKLGPLWDRFDRVVADLGDASSVSSAVKSVDPEYVFHLAKDREGSSFEREARSSTALASVLSSHAPRLRRWVRTAHAAPASLGRGADQALATSLSDRFKVPLTTLELYLVYGPGQNPGDFPRDLAEAALDARPLPVPAESKDLVFVDDVASAYLLAAQSPKAAGAWIPVGGGRLVPGLDAARAAAKAAGRPHAPAAFSGPARDGGHPADLRLAQDLLGWSPRTGLDEGLRRMVQWLRDEREVRRA